MIVLSCEAFDLSMYIQRGSLYTMIIVLKNCLYNYGYNIFVNYIIVELNSMLKK